MIKKSTLLEWYVWIFIFVSILSSDSIYGIMYEILTPLKLTVIVIGAFGIVFARINRKFIVDLVVVFVVGIGIYLVTYFNGTSGECLYIILRIFCVYPVIVVCKRINRSFMEEFSKVVYFFAIIFLVIYIVMIFMGEDIPYVMEYRENLHPYKNYGNIYFQINHFIGTIHRSHAYTWEPGQYMFYLNIALYYYLFVENTRENVKKIVILIVAIITTFSTMGYLILFLQLLFLIMSLKNTRQLILIKAINIITIVICAYLVYSEKTTTGSYMVRTMQLNEALILLKDNFVVGVGLRGLSITNGLFALFVELGVLIILITVVAWGIYIKNNIQYFDKRYKVWLFVIIFVLGLMNEPIQYTSFIFMLYWMMFTENHRRRVYNEDIFNNSNFSL